MRGITVLALSVCGLPVIVGCGAAPSETGEGEQVAEQTQGVIPAVPTTVSPNNSAPIACKPLFVWNAVAGADTYELLVSDSVAPNNDVDGPGAAGYSVTRALADCNDGTGMCQIPIQQLGNLTTSPPTNPPNVILAPGQGSWFVRAVNEDGASAFSTQTNFTIRTPGQTKNLVPAPGATLVPTNPTFQWQAAAGTEVYRLWVNEVVSGTKVIDVSPTTAQSGCDAGQTTCTFNPGVTLSPNVQYEWQMLTWNSTNFIGCWSELTPFTTAASGSVAAPVLISPTGPKNNPPTATNLVTFSWFAVSGAANYWLWVDSGATSGIDIDVRNIPSSACSGSTCSYTTSVTLPSANAKWWVKSCAGACGSGPGWSSAGYFKIGNVTPPVLVSPTGAITDTTPTYTWNAQADVSVYELWVNDTAGKPKVNHTYTPTAAGCAAGTGTCSVTPTEVIASGAATWWVRANGGDWSTPLTFSVP